MDPDLMLTLRGLHHGTARYGAERGGDAQALDRFSARLGVAPGSEFLARGERLPCYPYVHPQTKTCAGNVARRWWRGFLLALQLYAPIQILPVLLFKFRSLRSAPVATLAGPAQGTAQVSHDTSLPPRARRLSQRS